MNNKFSKKSGWIDTNDDRPIWQKDRGERHGNNRKWKSKEKRWERKKECRIGKEKFDLF